MITPTVTEITRALEPIDRDTFSDVPTGAATLAGLRSRRAASGFPGAAPARRSAAKDEPAVLRTMPRRAADDALFMLRARAA